MNRTQDRSNDVVPVNYVSPDTLDDKDGSFALSACNRRNIFSQARHSCLRLHGRDWTAALNSDHNCWFQSDGPMALWKDEKINAGGFLESQRQRGMDTRSLVADPKFLDAARHDYRLAPDSPARALTHEGRAVGALP